MREPVWATPQQTLLLRAALAEDSEEAAGAWRAWRLNDDLHSIDPPSQRLLPLLYRRLAATVPDEPLLPRLKGVYRYHWYRNQRFLRRGVEVVRLLREAEIEPLVLKGAALAALHYRDLGARPFEDFDVLVRPERAAEAAALLEGDGWRGEYRFPRTLDVRHDHNLVDVAGHRLDLHWTSLWEPGPDEGFHERAVSCELAGEPVLVLDSTDAFFAACAHGVQWEAGPMVRWAADAVTILRGSALDWARVTAQARERRLAHALASQLAFLVRELGAPVPREVVAELATVPAGPLDRLALYARLRPYGTVRGVTTAWIRYRRLATVAPDPDRPRFLPWLRESLDLDGNGQLLAFAARRLARLPAASYGHRATRVRPHSTG